MEFSVASAELYFHLNKVIGPVGTNPVMPILEDFLFKLSGDELTITATDLETTITTTLSVSSEDSGLFTCPAKMLLETVKALQNQPITIEINTDNHHIDITSSFGKYSMSGHDPSDYPEVPRQDDVDSITLPEKVLTNAINKTLFAVSNDEMRKTMTGVYFQIDFNKITFVATDAHKLVKYEYNGMNSDVTTSFVLPKKSLVLLKSVIENEEDVAIEFNKSHAMFTCGSTMLACLMLDGKYPDYKMVIPAENPNILQLRKNDLLQSLKRLSIFANKTTNQTVFNVTENSLTLTSQDLDYSNEATEQLECEYTGKDLFIAFNAKFLIEMINASDTENLVFKLDEPNRPGILVPENNAENEDLLMLIMPVMLNY